jgi:multidrug resistance efflux pump
MGFSKQPIDYKAELEKRDKIIARQAEQIKQLKAKIEELTKLLEGKAESKAAKKPKFTENYSLEKNSHKKKDVRNQRDVVPKRPSRN